MLKLKHCKELNYFDHYGILEYLDNTQLNKLYNQCVNYNTIQLQSKHYKDNNVIIHKSSKKNNIIQVSYFDKFGVYSDKERLTLKDALKEVYKDYIVKEVC